MNSSSKQTAAKTTLNGSSSRRDNMGRSAKPNCRNCMQTQLQRVLGNRSLSRTAALRNHIHPKVKISEINDPPKEEADRVAHRSMLISSPSAPPPNDNDNANQSFQGYNPGTPQADIQLRRKSSSSPPEPSPPIASLSFKLPGRPLDAPTRDFFEPRFGHNLGPVRIHTGPAAEAASESMHAKAFTYGNDIIFNRNQYAPHSGLGRELLAHELVHVIQSGKAQAKGSHVFSGKENCNIQPKLKISRPGDSYEREADHIAKLVTHTPQSSLNSPNNNEAHQTGNKQNNPIDSLNNAPKAFAPESNAGSGNRLLTQSLARAALHNAQGYILCEAEPGAAPEAVEAAYFNDAYLEESRQAIAQIHPLLSLHFFDWAVTEREAHTALQILQRLSRSSPAAFLHARRVMQMSGDWRVMVRRMSEADRIALIDLDILASPNQGYIMPGDNIRLEVRVDAEAEPELSLEYNVWREGVRVQLINRPIPIVGRLPRQAATMIAHAYHEEQILFEPHIRLLVTQRGGHYAPNVGPTSQSIWFTSQFVSTDRAAATRRARQAEFLSYIRAARGDDPLSVAARGHYLHWIEEHRNTPEFLTRTPADLWSWALRQASTPPPPSPAQPFLEMLRAQQARMQAAEGDARTRLLGTLQRYTAWLDVHMTAGDLARFDPARIWARMYVRTFQLEMAQIRSAYASAAASRMLVTPEDMDARGAKFNEFMQLALQLWGYTVRHYPYRIPVPSEGRDYLVTGDPAHQIVLSNMAGALMDWATQHMFDADYLRANPTVVLADVVLPRYQAAWDAAATAPLAAESIERHELVPERVIAAFGETVAVGLLVIALAGAAVGLGVPLVVVGGILLGLAGVAGISSYLARRQEIEHSRLDVPIPETMLASVGDVVGLSQVLEGITGERISTGRRLGSIERSEGLGTGAGNITLLLTGSRVFRAGQVRGQQLRLSMPGEVPLTTTGIVRPYEPGPLARALRATLPENLQRGFDVWLERVHYQGGDPEVQLRAFAEADRTTRVQRIAERETRRLETAERIRARETAPPGPTPRADDPIAAARARLPQELRIGFDEWVDSMIRAGRDRAQIEAIVRGMNDSALRGAAQREARFVREAMLGELQRQRLMSAALRPARLVIETRGRVTVRYDEHPPEPFEIQQAQAIAERTGEPVEVFGDSYPGIDGVIGEPPRPISLKFVPEGQNPNFARFLAEEGYESARSHGYTHVEVHIRARGSTMAEMQAQWNGIRGDPSSAGRGTLFDSAGTISRYVVECADGVWVVEAPVTGPALPGVGVPVREERGTESVEHL